MKLIINGQEKDIKNNLSLEEIINNLNKTSESIACAVNMNIVKKCEWNSYLPKENDLIEILYFNSTAG